MQISTDPIKLYGEVGLPTAGILGGLGRSWESGKVVRSCLMVSSRLLGALAFTCGAASGIASEGS